MVFTKNYIGFSPFSVLVNSKLKFHFEHRFGNKWALKNAFFIGFKDQPNSLRSYTNSILYGLDIIKDLFVAYFRFIIIYIKTAITIAIKFPLKQRSRFKKLVSNEIISLKKLIEAIALRPIRKLHIVTRLRIAML
jgi:hypothetical protein